MKNILFSTAVILILGELRKKGPFSVHDITKSFREKVNNFEFGLKDRQQEIINNGFSYRIDHEDVKQVFYDLLDNGVISNLTQTFNGTFNVFENSSTQPVKVKATINLIPTVAPSRYSKAVKAYPEILDYLSGRKGQKTTMKQIQSRFKGISRTCADYADIMVALGYLVCDADQTPSKQSVMA